jgi:hypothetical protein
MTIEQIWENVLQNKEVNWSNSSYKITKEPIYDDNQYQLNHFTRRGKFVLRVTCKSNYFGSLLEKTDLNNCFIRE